MKILITGHKGFIGSHLMQALENDYADIMGIDLEMGDDLLDCHMPQVDFDVIFHLAAQTSVAESWKYPQWDCENIEMTLRLLKHYPNAKIIYTQSAAAEDASSPYGLSKKTAGEYIKMLHENQVTCVLPNVFGPGGKGVVDIFKRSEKVVIFGSGKQTRDFVHVGDIVKGLIKAIKWPSGIYCMGSEYGVQIGELCFQKEKTFESARKEIFESILKNTTPNWKPVINVLDYLHEK